MPTITWVLNMCHHQFLCSVTSRVQSEVQALKTNLKTEVLKLASNAWL